jgi:hypothetical protein
MLYKQLIGDGSNIESCIGALLDYSYDVNAYGRKMLADISFKGYLSDDGEIIAESASLSA